MSTVTVVKKNGMVAIAADTLSSFGMRRMPPAYDRRAGKIFRIGESYVGLTGWSVHQQVLEHAFGSIGDPPALASATEIFDVFLALHQRLKQQYFLNPRTSEDDPYESAHMSLLIANRHGIFGLYAMRSVIEHERFWASGSGSDYALGAMHAVYDGAGDAAAIAEAGVRAGVEFDDGTAAPVESHVIPLAGWVSVDELDRLLKA